MSKNKQSQAWCFTLFTKLDKSGNYSPTFVFDEDKMAYAIMQVEECPTTAKLHFQGYVEFKNRVAFKRAKRLLQSDTVRITIAKGSSDHNRTYCTKEETRVDGPWEFGETLNLPGQGARTDIEEFLDVALSPLDQEDKHIPEFSGATHIRDVNGDVSMFFPLPKRVRSPFGQAVGAHTDTFVKYHRGLEKAYEWLRESRGIVGMPYTIYIYGPTGLGKTKQAYMFDKDTFKMPYGKDGSLWFDGYTDQRTILLDELREGRVPTAWLLQFLDQYDFQLEVKGTFRPRECKYVFITSCYSPEELWGAASIEYPQIMRRIAKVYEIGYDYEIICRK